MSRLRPKTKATLDEILRNPKISHTEAYMMHHKTTNRRNARAEVARLTAKPSVQLYLQQHIDKAKTKIVHLVDSNSDKIALQASESILDRALGKPVQPSVNKHEHLIKISLGDNT